MNLRPNFVGILRDLREDRVWLIRLIEEDFLLNEWSIEYYCGWEDSRKEMGNDSVNLSKLEAVTLTEVDYTLWLEAILEDGWKYDF